MQKSILVIMTSLLLIFPLGCASTKASQVKLLASDDVPESVEKKVRLLAESQPLLKSALKSSRVVYVGTEITRQKSESGEDLPTKNYRAIHYRYDDDTAIFTRVNPAKGLILEQQEWPHFPVSLAKEELDAAAALALADPKVKRALGKDASRVKVEALVIRTSSEKDPWFGRRVVRLLFKVGRDYRHNPKVIVDLTKKTVQVETD